MQSLRVCHILSQPTSGLRVLCHRVFYMPLFLNQRVTWGADLTGPIRRAVDYVRGALPYWNASGGRDHVFFIFGERQTCLVPPEIRQASIIVGHWGDVDCMSRSKDVVVPTITPIQHDLPRYGQRLQPAMRKASAASFERNGPLLLFAGGITSFSASQDNLRKGGADSEAKQRKWLDRVIKDPCARPEVSCRNIYSMGVRQAVWRQRLWAEPDMRIVSAGIPDYDTAVPQVCPRQTMCPLCKPPQMYDLACSAMDVLPLLSRWQAHFCLHTEGNGWGARVVDYMAMECLPLMVNDGMIFPYSNIINWDTFAIHLRKRQARPRRKTHGIHSHCVPSLCTKPTQLLSSGAANSGNFAKRISICSAINACCPTPVQASFRLVAARRPRLRVYTCRHRSASGRAWI